uniref:28S ribosomal protein S14, mitochondrial n=1 Tax=Simulium vittatum TaxID=7192 RepID=B5M0Y1_SIMVI|nr:mitochondrial 28S ribosomal protein S14 [Simulium vittatum]
MNLRSLCSSTGLQSAVIKSYQVGGFGFQQIRNKWADWRMIKDVKRRRCVAEHAKDRLRVNSLRKNDILPIEIREIADAEIAAFPRDSSLVRVRERCALTSRPRGNVFRWRVSRIVWRHLADYNKLSGVQRAMW